MKKHFLIPAVTGLITAILVALYLLSLENTYKSGYENVKVLKAKQYVDQGVLLDASMVEEAEVPKTFLQPRSIQSPEELMDGEGRRIFMTIVPVAKGEQIVTTKLFMLGLDTGLSAVVPADKRSVTLLCNRQDTSGIIKPGSKIDVIGIFDYEDKNGRMQQLASTILQNILVLSVDRAVFGGESLSEQRKKDSAFPESPEGKAPVSLALTPHEAEILALAEEKGVIKFSLRGMGDDRVIQTRGAKFQDFSNDASATAAAKSNDNDDSSEGYIKTLQKKQREALELLNKYRSR